MQVNHTEAAVKRKAPAPAQGGYLGIRIVRGSLLFLLLAAFSLQADGYGTSTVGSTVRR